MPLDIMSGFSGGAAPMSATQTGAPSVNASEPTVTFASLLTGKAAASPQGAVKKSGDGTSAKTDDDSKSDTKTEDASATLDPSLLAQNLVLPIAPPQVTLQQIQSEPNVPSTTEPTVGNSVAMDTSQILPRQAGASLTGGELLSTLKETIASAAGKGSVPVADSAKGASPRAAQTTAGAGAQAAQPVPTTQDGAVAPVVADQGVFSLASVSTAGQPAAQAASQITEAAPRTASLLSGQIVAQPIPVAPPALSQTVTGSQTPGPAQSQGSAQPVVNDAVAKIAASIPPVSDVKTSALAAVSQTTATSATVNIASPAVASSVQTAAVASAVSASGKSIDLSEKLPLQKLPGRADNKTVNDVRALNKSAVKEDATSLLQSLNGKASLSQKNSSFSSLSEALVKAEIAADDSKNGNDLTTQTTLTGTEAGKTAPLIQDQQTPAQMPAQDRAAMITKVVDKISEMKLDAKGTGGDKVTLQLHPQDWGQLNLTVTMTPKVDASGQTTTMVTAHVTAENPTVKQALESSMNDLRRTLHEHGLKLDNLTVTVDTVSAASASSQSNGSGLMSDHQSDQSAQQQASQSSAQSGSFDGSQQGQRSFADFGAGQFGDSRRGQQGQQQSWTAHDADLETAPSITAVRSSASGRVDVRA